MTGMFLTRPEIAGTFGVAASTRWIATGVAVAVLERGANAADAAAAGGLTLQVVEPQLNGPGGGRSWCEIRRPARRA
jgi:gamma-glutamyltranspeptidase/glutathione hydrolase